MAAEFAQYLLCVIAKKAGQTALGIDVVAGVIGDVEVLNAPVDVAVEADRAQFMADDDQPIIRGAGSGDCPLPKQRID